MKTPQRQREVQIDSLPLAKKIRDILADKKGENIVIMDVHEISSVTDLFVMVSGTSAPHLKALGSEVERRLKKEGIPCAHRAGTFESHWIVLDYFSVVVHIFLPEVREYYSLERLWSDAPTVP